MRLSEIVDGFMDTPPVGLMLDRGFVMRSLRKAVRFYCGFQKLASGPLSSDEIHDDIDAGNEAGGPQDFDLTPSEFSIIRPLFDLYVEHENAMTLEASRGLGVDVFGRQVSEIAQEITLREEALPKLAFMEPAVTV